MFALKRPCNNCPFRKGVGETFQLAPKRLTEIFTASAFQCHKTIDYENFEDSGLRHGSRPQQCAGLMAVLTRDERPNQIMQVAQRLGVLDPRELDPDNEAYEGCAEVRRAHR